VKREIPQVLIGLLALAVTVPVTAAIVMNGIRDVKGTRDTIVVTGSAKQPITADLALWTVNVSSRERTVADAARSENAKAVAVDEFLRKAGLASDVSKPPLEVQETTIQVPSGLKKPRFRSVQAWFVAQSFNVQTDKIDALVRAAAGVDRLLLHLDEAAECEVRRLAPRNGRRGGACDHDCGRTQRPHRGRAQRAVGRLPDHAAQLDGRQR
jgi:hypothetical protein